MHVQQQTFLGNWGCSLNIKSCFFVQKSKKFLHRLSWWMKITFHNLHCEAQIKNTFSELIMPLYSWFLGRSRILVMIRNESVETSLRWDSFHLKIFRHSAWPFLLWMPICLYLSCPEARIKAIFPPSNCPWKSLQRLSTVRQQAWLSYRGQQDLWMGVLLQKLPS